MQPPRKGRPGGAREAELIEFFTTGMAFREELADAALAPLAES